MMYLDLAAPEPAPASSIVRHTSSLAARTARSGWMPGTEKATGLHSPLWMDRVLRTGRRVMLEVLVNHLGDVQFEVKARNHVLYCDQPAENGGYDEGMTPPELFLASLGTCAGFYAVQY